MRSTRGQAVVTITSGSRFATSWWRLPPLLLVLSLIGACSGLDSGAGAGAVEGAEGEATLAQGDVECRKYTVTGSNLPRRVCRSKEAWARIDRVERDVVDEYGRQTRENSAVVQPGSSRGLPTVL